MDTKVKHISMSRAKDREVAAYLAAHRTEWGTERLNAPKIWRIDVALLPHNEMFNDEFWAAVGNEPYVTIAEQPDETWKTTL